MIAKGESKVGSVGGGSAPSSAPAASKPAEKAKPAAEKKPEPVKVEEPEEEDFNLDLFG